jgi:hypothetical protein
VLALASTAPSVTLACDRVRLAILWRHRTDDISIRAAWVLVDERRRGKAAVLVASVAVALTCSGWPDILVGLLIAAD